MISQPRTPEILSPDFRGHWAQVAVALSSLLPSVTDDSWYEFAEFERDLFGTSTDWKSVHCRKS